MNDWDKQELYLQGAETYYYLNQVHCTSVNTELFQVFRYFSALITIIFFSVLPEGGSCELKGKQDKQDFQLLLQCFETIGLHADQISAVWAILSSILQLGNMCFSSYEVRVCRRDSENQTDEDIDGICQMVFLLQSESFEVARIFSEAEARRVGRLLQISSEALQTVITHRITVSNLSCTSQLASMFPHV